MTAIQLVKKDKNLLKAFKKYQERYLRVGKKPDVTKMLPNDLYSTMRLEGEKVTRKQAQTVFQS